MVALLGFDFMLAADGSPYLIEANANPLLSAGGSSARWHEQLVARMVRGGHLF